MNYISAAKLKLYTQRIIKSHFENKNELEAYIYYFKIIYLIDYISNSLVIILIIIKYFFSKSKKKLFYYSLNKKFRLCKRGI